MITKIVVVDGLSVLHSFGEFKIACDRFFDSVQNNALNLNMLKTVMHSGKIEAGCDEVGRGCLAGPVVAAAVIMPEKFNHPLIKDSKKLSVKNRKQACSLIRENAISYAIGEVSPREIDSINILQASFLAMHKALNGLNQTPDHILVDGNRFTPYGQVPFTTVIKGDNHFTSIAAASILAKDFRDELMAKWGQQYPEYGWKSNVGYPTVKHRDAIRTFGTTPLHRISFKLLPEQLTLELPS